MRTPFLFLAAVAAAGCSGSLTRAGRDVRLVEGAAVERCTLVGVVTGTGGNGPGPAANEERATVVVRNRVAERGGNAYAVISRETTSFSVTVKADALRCPYWEPVPCLAPASPGSGSPCGGSAPKKTR